MKSYNVKMMSRKDYSEYMEGGWNCSFIEKVIVANNKREAYEIACKKYPKLRGHEGWVEDL